MNVIIVFQKIENGNSIKRILQQSGYEVHAVCTTGAQALQHAHNLSGGIIVSGYRFVDMMYTELHDYLPPQFEMLLVASAAVCDSRERQDIVCVKMPLQVHELLDTMHMMSGMVSQRKKKLRQQPKVRSEEEKGMLTEAKKLLMTRNNLSEEEAHRYLQKRSMENGTGLIETAQMILSLLEG